ncbi:MAG: helix-turn-helix domain-containing protein, partial [Candidatus Competibacteraceae bacterium]|nr:helix-turn-helix domain-containing protein [Candidatus Competibacteraceae bacterium]
MTEPPPQDPASSASKVKTTRYSAPALEKGLQILELLADQESGLSQNQIAQQLGRSVNEIFRMLNCLEQFGYIYRQRPEDLYYLTLKLFELGHHQPPLKRLLMAAQQPMRKLVNQIRSSCHLTVLHNNQMMVVARQD